MSEPLIVIDSSEVREGKLEELALAIKDLATFVEANESRPIAYNVYLSDNGRWMTVVQIHPDSESMELHMQIAGPTFQRFEELIRLSTMDVYGKPSEYLLGQLHRKVEMLGTATIRMHDLHAGFARFGG